MSQDLAVYQTSSLYPATVQEARELITKRATKEQAITAAKLILSAYPRASNPTDAECYITLVVGLLMSYPPEAVHKLCTTIVAKTIWVPTVAELKIELDKLMNYATRKVDIHDQEQKQLAERVA
jgi:hypothetical protein